MNHIQQSAFDLVAGLKAGQFSAEEVADSFVRQIERHDTAIGSFLRFDGQQALQQSRTIDGSENKRDGLAGIPIAIKDVICVRDQVTSCSSRMLESFLSPYDATVVEKLRQSKAVMLGKTNMDEFAMGSSNETSVYGNVVNPWKVDDRELTPGGSSGGSPGGSTNGSTGGSTGGSPGGSMGGSTG